MNAGDLKRFVERHRAALVGALLAAVTAALYWRVARCEFTNFDETIMVLQNPYVLAGLTPQSLSWALTASWFEYWHPLTWWSHMLDCELFGVNAAGHHLVNAAFHVANTALLLVVLRRMTGALWRSALVAALFALHPLHVESVAWIAERKDVLSGFFFLLTLWAYARYAEGRSLNAEAQRAQRREDLQPRMEHGLNTDVEGRRQKEECRMQNGGGRNQHPLSTINSPTLNYSLSLFFFACGLMSKPMLVTVPFVLLLLDYWPLQRLQLNTQHSKLKTPSLLPPSLHHSATPPLRLFVEKLPFFLLSAASCAITYFGVKAEGGLISAATVPWAFRVTNVPVAYARYLEKTLWPEGLAVLYPMPNHWAWWQVAGALVLLAACSCWALARARRQPWLAVGWCWFVGMLVPVIGLVQVGRQAMADRYTYLSLIGLFVAVVWSAAEWLAARRAPRWFGWTVSGLVLAACAGATWTQLGCWRDSATLWLRALAVTTRNARAHHNYGLALRDQGRFPDALAQYREALRIDPDQVETLNNLGCLLCIMGTPRDGTNYLMRALRLNPKNNQVRVNIGRALIALGDSKGAREYYGAAMAARPDDVTIPCDWGRVLLEHNEPEEAMEHFGEALQIMPGLPAAREGYASALAQVAAGLAARGKVSEAVGRYRQALMMHPDLPEVLNNLAWTLATARDADIRDGAEAVRLAERACALTQNRQALFVGTLAAAYAENGQFEEARGTAQQAIGLAQAAGQKELVARNRELLKLYDAGQPCRE